MPLTRYFGLGRETTFAEAVAPDRYIETESDLKPDQGWILPAAICDCAKARFNTGPYRVRGNIGSFDVSPNNIGELLTAVLGCDGYSVTEKSKSGAFISNLHEWTCSNTIPSYTISIGAEHEERILPGMLINKLLFKVSHGENLKATAEAVGPGSAELTSTLESLTRSNLTSLKHFKFTDASGYIDISDDDRSATLYDFELEISNNIPFERGNMNSRFVPKSRMGTRTVQGKFSAYFDDDVDYELFMAAEAFNIEVTFTGEYIDDDDVGPRYYTFHFYLPKCVFLRDAGHPIMRQDEPLVIDVPFQAIYDVDQPDYSELFVELENLEERYCVAACPSGEQLVNGDFETGDLTGWTLTGDLIVDTLLPPHGGTYCLRTIDFGDSGSIKQFLIDPVPVSCMGEGSEFTMWIRGTRSFCPSAGNTFAVEIFYTDDTSTYVERETTEPEDETWVQWDLEPYLEPDKTIEAILISLQPGLWYTQRPAVDDVTFLLT